MYIVNPTVRFGVVIFILRCGSVQFAEIRNITVRFSEIRNPTVRFGAVFTNQTFYGAARRGSPLNGFSYGAVPLPVGKTGQHRFFSTVHRMNIPCKTAVSYGSRAFSRGTNATAVFLPFLYGASCY